VGEVAHATGSVDTDYSMLDRYKVMHRGERVALLPLGNMYQRGERVAARLAEQGIDATLINPRYASGTDEELLRSLLADHAVVATLEDGSLDGGFGERIARFYGPTPMRVLCFGVRKQLYDRYDVGQLLRDNHLTEEQITADILQVLG
jgi:1-deoxy-D-xylulose-5-phosphate synthase